MSASENEPVMPNERGSHSSSAGLAQEMVIWVGEVFVGLAPLAIHLFLRRFSAIPVQIARCHAVVAGQGQNCQLVDGLDAEICILAVVLSGLALVPMPAAVHGTGPAWRFLLRYITALFVGSIMVASAMAFVLITAGIDRDVGAIVAWLLGGAVVSSLMMAIERAWRRH